MLYLYTEMIVSKVFMYFDGGSKASLYCILRDRWNNLGTVLVSQNTLKNTGPRAGTIHNQFRIKCKFVLVSKRSAGSPLAWGPIRRNRSNRLKTGPGVG